MPGPWEHPGAARVGEARACTSTVSLSPGLTAGSIASCAAAHMLSAWMVRRDLTGWAEEECTGFDVDRRPSGCGRARVRTDAQSLMQNQKLPVWRWQTRYALLAFQDAADPVSLDLFPPSRRPSLCTDEQARLFACVQHTSPMVNSAVAVLSLPTLLAPGSWLKLPSAPPSPTAPTSSPPAHSSAPMAPAPPARPRRPNPHRLPTAPSPYPHLCSHILKFLVSPLHTSLFVLRIFG